MYMNECIEITGEACSNASNNISSSVDYPGNECVDPQLQREGFPTTRVIVIRF